MSACIWYITKYTALPSARKGTTRPFLLLREMVKLGHRCVLLTSDSNHLTTPPKVNGRDLRQRVEGVDVCWVRTLKFSGAGSVRRILSWFDFEWRLWRVPKKDFPRPDAVIVSSPSLLTILNGLWLRRRYRCRLIFEVRDIWPLTLVEEGGYSRRHPFIMAFRAIEKLAYRLSDEVVGTMPNLSQHLNESLHRHAPVSCIPFGMHPDMVENVAPLPPGWMARHVPAGRFIVCYAGTIGLSNALETLFDCARAMQDVPDVHFLIVGEGGLAPRFETLHAGLPNVTFAGGVPKDMVQSVLKECDLLFFSVLPSRVWEYGLSLNKVIDYMLAAKPITASYTGYPTMVEEAGAGTSVPAGDPKALKAEILRLKALPPAVRDAMGSRGREWLLANRNYRKLAEDYLSVALRGRARNQDCGGAGPSHIRTAG